jgi:26S proteasome regulatory subunit N3
MPSKTPHTNGTDPVENGVNGNKEVEMKDEISASAKGAKGKKAKDGEEELTVVVPPPKGGKLSAPPSKDDDGDVTMEASGDAADGEGADSKVDPITKTILGLLKSTHYTP